MRTPAPALTGRPGRVLALVGILALAAPSAATAAGWSAPVTVSRSATFLDSPFIGFGASGRGLAAWSYQNGVGASASGGWRAAPRGLAGRFGAERDIPPLAAPPVVYARDRVVAVSEPATFAGGRERARIRVAFGSTSGRFGRPRTVDTIVPAYLPALAANDRGHVAVAYLQRPNDGPRAVTLAERRPRASFGRPRIVARRGGPTAVTVAVGAHDDLVVAWVQSGGVMARVRPAGGRLGPVVRLGAGATQSTRLRAAVSSRGAVWVAWASQLLTEGGDAGPYEVRVAVRPARAGAFRRARLLERHDQRASDEADIDLALDPGGAGFVAWSGWDGASMRARLAAIDARGRSAAIHTLSQPGYGAVVHDLATSRRRGEALVAWARLDAVGEVGTQVLAGLLEPGGVYAGEEAVSDADRARIPAAAFDPVTGTPTVVWSQRVSPDGPGVPIAQITTVLRAATRLR